MVRIHLEESASENGAEQKGKRKNREEWTRRKESLIPLSTSTSADEGNFCRRLGLNSNHHFSSVCELIRFSKILYTILYHVLL